MKQIKEQLKEILCILKKIDTTIVTNTSIAVNKIITTIDDAYSNDINKNLNKNNNKIADIILENAALTAKEVIDKSTLTAINVIDKAALTAREVIDKALIDKDSENSNFDYKMYIKCLIHELRTPQSNLLLGINFIENNFIEYDKNNELLNITDSLYKSLEFLEDILTKFCLIENGKLILNKFEPFSIKKLFSDVDILLQYTSKEHQTSVVYNIDENICDTVYGDIVNIKHCIINLINNAIKYNNHLNNTVIINVNLINEYNEYQSLIISILDDNNYIPTHIKDKLFQPFNSTSGSGLGLYICKQILELHDGSIEHEYISNHTKGNQFNIFIDLKIHKLIFEENIITHTSSINENIDENIKYNIIIVDDSELTIKLMHKIFKSNIKINNITTATNGLDAIQKICNDPNAIDIVFIDNEMPKLNGIQTVKLLRGIHFDKIIIGISGSSDLSEFNYCGIDYLFSKPLDKNKIEIISSFLNKDDLVRQYDKKLQLNNFQLEWV